MPQKLQRINVEVDRETKRRLEKWKDAECLNSQRHHLKIILRDLAELSDLNPAKLAELGMISARAMRALAR